MKKTLSLIIALLAVSGFSAFAKEGKDGDKPKHERKTFEQADADKDGKVSADEFKALMPKLDATKCEGIFKKKDADSNGSLSKEEYEKMGDRKKADKPK